MENNTDVLPSLIRDGIEYDVAGVDTVNPREDLKSDTVSTSFHSLSTPVYDIQAATTEARNGLAKSQPALSVSISMPSSCDEARIQSTVLCNEIHDSQKKQAEFHCQPMPESSANQLLYDLRTDKLIDGRFDPFKTWSGRLERQLSHLRGKHYESEIKLQTQQPNEIQDLPAERYFDALKGPELNTLKDSEEILLPENEQWPFLLRFPITSFGVCLGVSSQAIMWKALASSTSTKFLHISHDINLVLWIISIVLVAIIAFTYSLKVIFFFEAVRREYYHPVRINFFFAPWVALLFLALGAPTSVFQSLHTSLWYVLMAPILCLEIKIYGQWMSGGRRRLSKVANPANHLSIVGNFVGALLGFNMGLKEGPIFFFSIGLTHYLVLLVTLYQRLPTNKTLPKELHPIFFLFVAAPSVASMAWARIQGSFDYGSRLAYFIGLFLYIALAVRVNFFRGFQFSLAWWAYTFPMTGAATATIRYSNAVNHVLTKSLTVLLCTIATLVVTALLVTTLVHAFVLGNLFPNDIAIAISDRKPKKSRKWYRRSSDGKSEKFLKFSNSDEIDVEASISCEKQAAAV